ncbi:unnamed protein product [Closterium sp. NIES-64]|nr:unnamed protein product [Closterium sp. NIES-64]
MNHHARSIAAYRDFVSRHPDIELVSAHDFFMDAPESLKSEPGLEKDPHRLMLQRLNYELHQRKELVRAREMLEIRRRTLQESISSRKKFLGSLPGQLKALKKASGPLQQQMGMQHSRRVKQHRLASLLPPPLYVLYSQLAARRDSLEEAIEVEIEGSVREAEAFAALVEEREAAAAAAAARGGGEEGQMGEEEDGEEGEGEREREEEEEEGMRRRRRKSDTENDAAGAAAADAAAADADGGGADGNGEGDGNGDSNGGAADGAGADAVVADGNGGGGSGSGVGDGLGTMGTAMVVSEGGGKQAQVNAGIGAADLIGAVDSPHPLAVVLRLLDARGRAERGNAEAVGQGGERGAEEEEKVEKEKGKEKEKEKEKGKEREKSKAREKEDGQQPALLVLRFEMLWNLGIICDSGLLFPNMAKEPLARESGFVAALSARVSRPYYWAQLMCGLDFLPPLPPSFLLPPGSSAAAGAADGAATAAGAAAAASAAAAMEVEPSAATSSGAAAPPAAPSTAAAAGAAVAVAREGGAAETGPGGARAQLLERLEAFREERRLGRVLQAMRERVTAARELNAVLSSLVTSRLPTITPSHATVGPYSSGPWPGDSGYLPQCSILSWQLLIGPLGFPNATCSSQIGGKAEEGDLASGKGGEKRGKERRGEGRSEREGEKDRSDRKGDEKKGEEKKGDERKGDERKRDEKKGDERKGEKGSGEDGSSRGRGEGTGGGKGRDEAFGRLAVGGFGRESSLPVGGLGGECALPPGAMLAQALVIAQRRRLGGLAGAVGLGGVAGLAGVSGVEGGSGGKGEGGGKKRESEGKSSGRERRSSREGKDKGDEDGEKGRGGGSKRETEGKAAASGAIAAAAAGTEAAAEGPAGDGQGRGGSGGSGGNGGVEGGEGGEGVVWVALPWSWAAVHGIHPSTPAAVAWETVLGHSSIHHFCPASVPAAARPIRWSSILTFLAARLSSLSISFPPPLHPRISNPSSPPPLLKSHSLHLLHPSLPMPPHCWMGCSLSSLR